MGRGWDTATVLHMVRSRPDRPGFCKPGHAKEQEKAFECMYRHDFDVHGILFDEVDGVSWRVIVNCSVYWARGEM